ncbi:MAG: SH3 domain-containing protein [bacterium]|nr:SH3 domain-containing protein [bacterium]
MKRLILFVLAAAVVLVGLSSPQNSIQGQVFPTSTPVPVVLPSMTAPPTFGVPQPTSPPTFTPEAVNSGNPNLVQLQARQEAGSVNVRREALPDAEIVGSINPGDTYTILGRYFRWLQIDFPPSPTRAGWVYDELVEIIGDEALIADLTVQTPVPTTDPIIAAPTQTFEALAQIPGGFETSTANARVLEAPSANSGDLPPGASDSIPGANAAVLPTFTYPANLVAQIPTDNPLVNAQPQLNRTSPLTPTEVAPIVPIAVLTIAGCIGLLLSSMRR